MSVNYCFLNRVFVNSVWLKIWEKILKKLIQKTASF